MTLGPVEILVVAFPENTFSGTIVPELERLVENSTITIIDGVFIRKLADGTTDFFEFTELSEDSEAKSLQYILDRVEGLVSDEDITELTSGIAPGSSAAILVVEHTWATSLRNAVVGSGGELLESIRVPREAVEEILSTVPDND